VIAVSDSSPLIVLSKLGQLHLLRLLFERVFVPQEVHNEVVVFGVGLPGASEVRASEWIEVRALGSPSQLTALQERYRLGAGELGAIALAKQLSADTVLLDDLAARAAGKAEGLAVHGTLGILETSFRKGHLPDLRAVFEQFLAQGYIDKRLLNIRLGVLGLRPL
jgi:predicted nucleic acid-binding protein